MPPPENFTCDRQNKTKQNILILDKQNIYQVCKTKSDKKGQENRSTSLKSALEAAAAVCGTSSIR